MIRYDWEIDVPKYQENELMRELYRVKEELSAQFTTTHEMAVHFDQVRKEWMDKGLHIPKERTELYDWEIDVPEYHEDEIMTELHRVKEEISAQFPTTHEMAIHFDKVRKEWMDKGLHIPKERTNPCPRRHGVEP